MNKELYTFLSELQTNNQREWFKENKDRYDVLRKGFEKDIQLIIDQVASFDPEIAGLQAKECLFRIYRDIRFSPNKTPYKTHFSAYIARGGRKSERSGYYIHIEPGNSLVSGGIWQPETAILKKIRQDIYENIDEFNEILEESVFKAIYPGLVGQKLKRMPAGFPTDFSYEYLKHKDFCIDHQVEDSFFYAEDWLAQTTHLLRIQYPLHRFLNYSVDEYRGVI